MRRDKDDVLKRALDFEVAGRRGRGRLNMTWKRQVDEHTDQTKLKKEDAIDRTKLRDGSFSSFELFVVSFMQEDVYIGHTASALTLGLQFFS